jgi:hypothetical protein
MWPPLQHISLSPNKLHPRGGKLGREQRPGSSDDVTDFSHVFPTQVKSFFCGFRVDFKIHIIKVHITHPLESMVKTQCFPNINRVYTSKTDCSSQNKDSTFITDANADAGSITVTGERCVNVALHAAMLRRLPLQLSRRWNSKCSSANNCWL